jgi:hypothetical protein
MSMRVLSLSLGMLAACSSSKPSPVPGQALRPLPPICDPWGCGTNAATVANVRFHEVSKIPNVPNNEGLSYLDFFDESGPLELSVIGDRLRGIREDGTEREGTKLIGATLRLSYGPNAVIYRLEISGYQPTVYWVDPDAHEVPAYTFVVSREDDPTKTYALCDAPPENNWGAISGMAILYSGDRYRAAEKTLRTDDVDAWFNVACAGTALAKLHLMRHTAAASDPAHLTTINQRQALLKLVTADYCGTGESFTMDGRSLRYGVDQPWLNWWHDPITVFNPWDATVLESLDAVWDHTGATCLSVPRMLPVEYPPGEPADDFRAGIVGACAAAYRILPWCPDDVYAGAHFDELGYAISANPYRP